MKLANNGQSAVTHEDFVRAWQSSETAGECAEKLNLSKQAVHARATYLRAKGVKLHKLRAYQRLDIAALNKIAEKTK